MKKEIQLNVNGETYEVAGGSSMTLLDVIRDKLRLTGTKRVCDRGEGGACTVLVEGKPVNSCLVLAVEMEGKKIITIEGVEKEGKLDPIQQAFLEHGAVQCGYCTPGMILSAKALLDENPEPSKTDIREAISGNLCRCTGYVQIIEAIEAAAKSQGEHKK